MSRLQRGQASAGATKEQVETVRSHALQGLTREDLQRAVVDRIPQDARFVLIGEASHGTHDFYQMRADITKQLIQERGFKAVVAEADFPDMWRANCYVRGLSDDDKNARTALEDFKRFPRWMWRNTVFEGFVEWLKQQNRHVIEEGGQPANGEALCAKTTGVYGMDVYSLHASMEAVLGYLRDKDPETLQWVERRYRCFDRFGADSQFYGMAVASGMAKETCEACVKQVLDYVRKRLAEWRKQVEGGKLGPEGVLMVEANAMAVAGAEEYYRQMFVGEQDTWNIRDMHFLNACKLVERSLAERPGGDPKPKLVLWAHNSHVGDARYTDMGWRRGELNVGQLMRENYPGEVVNIGFSTHTGSVTAAHNWDTPARNMKVKPSRPDSFEHALHSAGMPEFAVDCNEKEMADALKGPLLERAIGVIYRPDTERQSHYFDAKISEQFDIVVHIDTTRAVEPLEWGDLWNPGKVTPDLPETFPVGV